MKLELTNEEALNLYRHAKALYEHLTKLLQNQMVIRCKVCNSVHRRNDPHVYSFKVDKK